MKKMVKKRYAWILAALLFAALLLAVPPVRAEQQEGDEQQEWTVMFYLCGSDLESKHSYASGNLFNRTVRSLPEVAGQEYTLLYPIIDSDVDRGIQYEASAPMTMYRALEIKPKVLPAGTYYLDYWVEDMFTHQLHVGIAGLNWDGEKISMLPDEQWEGVMTLDLPAE